ncbi:envelope glycoprotein UL33 [Human betaherpesvirus 5]|uniref:Envelope glycoprotein UL33 n=1 Tax=Human cytomegalovirus TaxID=10359 RepID=A0A0A7CF14_HCMV|nr:envelope glycoprotein UL33 [Human betaherpesvirus 5]AKI07757.1 envelope glycoprotein UL33 [Human betaherpesvirus 5]AMJ53403.1 envelope glycoprotein UL33 [Human betaherpesvirus 5]CAH0484087.1 envelope glycoprotein UL33 [Human betaherpesvirus 5]
MDTIIHNTTNRSTDTPHVNITCNITEPLSAIRTTEAVINTFIIFVGGPLNAIVLITQLLTNRVLGYSTPTIYMTNLYSTNFLTLTVLPFIVLSNQWLLPASVASCKFLSVIYYSSCTVGFATVALIAADRYRVLHKRTYARQSYRSTYIILLLTWFAGLIFSMPAAVYTTVVIHNGTNGQSSNGHATCVLYFIADEVYTVLLSWKVLLTLVWGAAPVIMMTWFYAFFYSTVQRASQKQRSRTLTFVSVLLISFVALQTPYVSIMIFNSYATAAWPMDCEHLTLRRTIGTLSRLVPHLHCLINPILYALLGHDFLQRMRQCFRGQLLDRRAFLRSQQNQRATAETNLAAGNNSQSVATSLDPNSKNCNQHAKRSVSFNFPSGTWKGGQKTASNDTSTKIPHRLSQSHHNLSGV